jgi:hypothetical protein
MNKRAHTCLVGAMLICASLVLPATAWTQQPTRQVTPEARQRWERFSAEEKRRLKAHFNELERLDPAQRQELERRAQLLRSHREEAHRRLPRELQRKLDGLEGEQRRQVTREFVRAEMQRRGSRIRDKLPQGWIERLEAAQPADRPRLLRQLREEMRRENDARALQQLAQNLRLGPEQVRELQAKAPERRPEALLALRRREIEARVESHGLPPGVSREEWDAWRELSAPGFFERWHERAPRFPARDQAARLRPETIGALRQALQGDPSWRREWRALSVPERRQRLEARLIERALEVLRATDELAREELEQLSQLEYQPFRETLRRLMGGYAPGPSGRAQPARSRQTERPEPGTLAGLRRAMRLDPEWVIEFGDLPAAERARRMQERRRERVLAVLEAAPEVDSRDLERLRSLSGREFREAVRRFAQRSTAQRPPR